MSSFIGVIVGLFTGLLSLFGIHAATSTLPQLPPPIQERTIQAAQQANTPAAQTPSSATNHYDQAYNKPIVLGVGQTATNAYSSDSNQYDSITLNRIIGSTATITYILRSVDCGLHCGDPLPMVYSTSTHDIDLNQSVCVGWTNSDNGMLLSVTAISGNTATVQFTDAGVSSDCNKKGDASAFETKRGEVTAIPGMSEYTDSDFGFSFWYPSNWTVNSPAGDEPGIGGNLEDCTFKKSYSVHGTQLSNGVSIGEYYCPDLSMTLRGADGANPVGMDFKYYFDTNTHTWMVSDLSDPPNGSPRTTSPADVSNNTMGGLHILAGEARFGADVVIPLSARNFLIVSTNDGGGYIDERLFAKTIVATDPSVATPVSAAQQTATIQAEKDAYAGQ